MVHTLALALVALTASAPQEPFLAVLPAATAAYSRPAESRGATGSLKGRLELDDTSGAVVRVLRDDFGRAKRLLASMRTDPLPGFTYSFVQVGEALVSARAGIIEGHHPLWDVSFAPGRVWADQQSGTNRATLPFALQERNANCTHYGLLTFRYDAKGSIDAAAWQIGSETCAYLKFDAWGHAKVRYVPEAVPDADRIVSQHAVEQANRKLLPIETLASRQPEAGVTALPGAVRVGDLTLFGLAVDGVHYVSACPTRFGPHPYCETLPLPSYSLAKSLFGGLGLMRAELLQPGTMQRRVAELVPQCRNWHTVTLDDALDMASGRYKSRVYEADENSATTWNFLDANSHATRIRLACSGFGRREAPGHRWVYHTTDTYVLGAALSAMRPKQDIYESLIVKPIWRALGLSGISGSSRRTLDQVRQPFVGYGLTFEPDDLLRIAGFLQAGGVVGGQALVDRTALAAALQRTPEAPGLEAGGPDYRYQNGFWARNVAGLTGCSSPIWVPFLSGYGGISLVLFPNGVSYYVVSDGFTYDWSEAARVAHRLRSLCPAGSAP